MERSDGTNDARGRRPRARLPRPAPSPGDVLRSSTRPPDRQPTNP